MDPVRIGLIGIGWWAREVHLKNLMKLPNVRVTALSSRDADNLGKGAELLDTRPACFADHRELLASDAAEAVIVCTPNHTHESITLEVLRAGKHALCEKPVSFTVEGCERLMQARDQAGVVCQAGLELRYSDVMTRVKELLAEGAVGAPATMWCNILRNIGSFSRWRADAQQSGGLFHELGCHFLDLLNFCADANPVETYAAAGSRFTQTDLDYFWQVVRYEPDVVANLGMCIFAPARDRIALEVVGEAARLSAEIIEGAVHLWPRGEDEPRDCSPARPADYSFDGFPGSLESLAAFAGCVRTGDTPLASLESARTLAAVVAAASESVESSTATRIAL